MVELMKGRKPQTGMNSVKETTTRITDSVAIYLPPNVETIKHLSSIRVMTPVWRDFLH